MSNFPQPLPTSLIGTSPIQTSQGRNKEVLWPKTVEGIFEFLGAAWQNQKDSGTQQEEADLKSGSGWEWFSHQKQTLVNPGKQN